MLLASGCDSLFLVTFQQITQVAVKEPVTQSALGCYLHAFAITGSEEVCDGVCF